MKESKSPNFSREVRERAVRMVFEHRSEHASQPWRNPPNAPPDSHQTASNEVGAVHIVELLKASVKPVYPRNDYITSVRVRLQPHWFQSPASSNCDFPLSYWSAVEPKPCTD